MPRVAGPAFLPIGGADRAVGVAWQKGWKPARHTECLWAQEVKERDGLFGGGHGAVESDHRAGTRLGFGGDDGDVVVSDGDDVAEAGP